MSIADKLLQVNQVKQDIKTAIETKGVPMTNVAFTEYANKILEISGGGGGMTYEDYAKAYYTITNNAALFSNAWQDSQDSETVLYDIPLELAEANIEDLGVDLYVGTNDQLEKLYNDCVNGVATIPFVDVDGIYLFGDVEDFERMFYIFDSVAVLGKDLGIVLAKSAGVSIPNNNIVIKQGFKFENENGIIIPESVTSIGDSAFRDWTSNNQPLVIPNSVTSIGEYAFSDWQANNQPLVIPDSITSIGASAFSDWSANTYPLVIPESVTSIGGWAFSNWQANNQPLVIPDSITSIGVSAFSDWSANNQPLVIPDSITSIGDLAFRNWTSNNQPLVIPNSVTSIGASAFRNWTSNNQPLVIPESVTSIGDSAFQDWQLVPYVEIHATTPPTLTYARAFGGQNNAPIYVPDESLDDYKAATNWVDLASRIFSINDK